MAQYLVVHPQDPQPRLIRRAADCLRDGGLIVYPTDSCYALGCHLGDKPAADRLRRVRGLSEKHPLTLVCRDLRELGKFAQVNNPQFRLLKAHTPGSYTFILKATREVPRRLQDAKRQTIGLRVPQHNVVQALLSELNEPIISATLLLPGEELPLNDGEEIRARLEHEVDLVLDAGSCGLEPTSIIDLSDSVPRLLRAGKGEVRSFGLDA